MDDQMNTTREESIAKAKERGRSYIHDRNITVSLTGEEADYIAVWLYHIKNPNPIAKKLSEIFSIKDRVI